MLSVCAAAVFLHSCLLIRTVSLCCLCCCCQSVSVCSGKTHLTSGPAYTELTDAGRPELSSSWSPAAVFIQHIVMNLLHSSCWAAGSRHTVRDQLLNIVEELLDWDSSGDTKTMNTWIIMLIWNCVWKYTTDCSHVQHLDFIRWL